MIIKQNIETMSQTHIWKEEGQRINAYEVTVLTILKQPNLLKSHQLNQDTLNSALILNSASQKHLSRPFSCVQKVK